MPTTPKAILALDVGNKRVGVAKASVAARLPAPLVTLRRDDNLFDELRKLIKTEEVETIVVGLPRGLDGQETKQTAATEAFAKELRQRIGLPVHLQDEALTSRKAETELEGRGQAYQRADVDALAAVYILEDYLAEHDHLEHLEPAP